MGIPNFPPHFDTDLCRPFYDGLAAGELRITACPRCGVLYWYPPEVLPCHSDAHAIWRTVSPLGEVYSFTTIERSLLPGAGPESVPHSIVLVEPIDAPGIRVVGLMVGNTEPACGMQVRLDPIKLEDHVLPGFVPTQPK